MLKTFFVLSLSLAASCVLPTSAQSPENATFKVSVVDNELKVRKVPKFALVIRQLGKTALERNQDRYFHRRPCRGLASAGLLHGRFGTTSGVSES